MKISCKSSFLFCQQEKKSAEQTEIEITFLESIRELRTQCKVEPKYIQNKEEISLLGVEATGTINCEGHVSGNFDELLKRE